MKHIHYAFQALLRGGVTNVIKIISLTLGIFVGVLLFARVAFELNYDNHYVDVDRLFYLQRQSKEKGGEWGAPSLMNYAPVGAVLKENFPKEIENATTLSIPEERTFFYGDRKIDKAASIFCGEHFFSTTGIRLLEGHETALADVDVAFVSRSLARRMSANNSVIGKTILLKTFDNNSYPLTIRGVYEDVPENTELRYDVIYTLPTYSKMMKQTGSGWGYDISYYTLVRFHQGTDVIRVQARMDDMMKKYIPGEKSEQYSFVGIHGYHADRKEVHRIVSILSVLGLAILLTAALNYVLISISSLDRRSKSVGVHKCNGASGKNIFTMFLCETGILLLIIILVVAALIFNFREEVEYIAEASLVSLFTWQVMWVPVLVVLVVFLVAVCLPGYLFASVPVTQVFRRYTEHRSLWKRPLLFVQFLGAPFILGLLAVVFGQYHHIINKELGYDPRGVVTVFNDFPNAEALFRSLPMVQDYSNGSAITSGYSGDLFTTPGGKTVNVRLGWSDFRFVPMMGMSVIEGRNFTNEGEALVNEEYVRQMCPSESPIGKKVTYFMGEATITGVMKDYPVKSAYFAQDPVVLLALPDWGSWTLRLKPPYDDNLQALNRTMKEMFPSQDIVFTSLQDTLNMQYDSVRRFRNAVTLASISIFLIALIGLLGYVNNEIRRRSKEIAIRKVNGAEASCILRMLSREVVLITLPAIVLGTVASWFIGRKWLEQFAEQVSFNPLIYPGIGVVILVITVACLIIRAWHIANENPVKSIKSE